MRSARSRAFSRCLAIVDQELHEPDPEGLFCIDEVACECNAQRLPRTHQAREALCPPGTGNQSQADLGLTEAGRLVGDTNVAGQGQLAAPPTQNPWIAAIRGFGNAAATSYTLGFW